MLALQLITSPGRSHSRYLLNKLPFEHSSDIHKVAPPVLTVQPNVVERERNKNE